MDVILVINKKLNLGIFFLYIGLFSFQVTAEEDNSSQVQESSSLKISKDPIQQVENVSPTAQAPSNSAVQKNEINSSQSDQKTEVISSPSSDDNFEFKAIKNSEEISKQDDTANEEKISEESVETPNKERLSEESVEISNKERPSEESLETSEEEKTQIVSDGISEEIKLKVKSFLHPYIYDPEKKKDPFQKPETLKEWEKVKIEDRFHPVENESIDAIKLRAIIWGKDNVIPRALFETSDGKSYTLTKNDRLGDEGSIIYRIDMDRILVMRPYFDPNTGLKAFEPYEKRLKSEKSEDNFYYEKLK